ncbi:glycosyltransferase [Antribacter gilvus]|uniref:glycosyltransferase n=1 Tax=Antribacter gilvus TaxID=2304675 RepID=UPI000F7763EB|nr:glycosyltransferase [Antribacter gilvus]
MVVPNVVHFAYTSPPDGTGIDFSLLHYCAVAAAYHYGRASEILIHATTIPGGYWWQRAEKLARIIPATVPEERFNSRFRHPAHQADAIRLSVLEERGGVFLDLDVITLQSFEPLLRSHGVVVGMEDHIAICPAVILAAPEAPFLSRWIAGYDPRTSDWFGFRSTGRDEHWGELSTRYPLFLADRHPSEVEVLHPSAFYPVHWRRKDTERLYRSPENGGLRSDELAESFTLHLWETGQWAGRLQNLTVSAVRAGETTLATLMAPLLARE